jgi:hypothetical protein
MTIYVRTEEGQLAAYSVNSALPRKLRSLLKVIDGKTPVEVYTASLKAFGDVQGVLKSFDMAGLITPMSQLPLGRVTIAEPSSAAVGPSTLWGQTKPNAALAEPSRSGGPTTYATFMNTRLTNEVPDATTSFVRSQVLTRAVESMSNFVLTHAPEHSFMVLKELEQLDSLEQLAVTLGGYEQLIAHVGVLAEQHVYSIKQLLRENL